MWHFVSHIPGWKGKLQFCAHYARWHATLYYDSPEPSENQQHCSNAKMMMSEGCFMHHLVIKAATTWSNCVFTAWCSFQTMVRYGSKRAEGTLWENVFVEQKCTYCHVAVFGSTNCAYNARSTQVLYKQNIYIQHIQGNFQDTSSALTVARLLHDAVLYASCIVQGCSLCTKNYLWT